MEKAKMKTIGLMLKKKFMKIRINLNLPWVDQVEYKVSCIKAVNADLQIVPWMLCFAVNLLRFGLYDKRVCSTLCSVDWVWFCWEDEKLSIAVCPAQCCASLLMERLRDSLRSTCSAITKLAQQQKQTKPRKIVHRMWIFEFLFQYDILKANLFKK